MTYEPILSRNQLILGDGCDTVVVTGWTLKETVARALDTSQYAAIGQLYSATRGISIILRNLFANPDVTRLIVVNATVSDRNAGGCRCLVDFFRHGCDKGEDDLGRFAWVIRSEVRGYIDAEIDAESLDEIRREVEVVEWSDSVKSSRFRELLSRSQCPGRSLGT